MNSIEVYLMVIVLNSTIAGWLFSRVEKSEKVIKVMRFMLFFWLFGFVQLIVFALLYQYKMLA
ncbi:MAG: hypothetical protein ABGX40_02645 [Methylococcales bacterium]|jgi:hypothetical protein|nr:hypothetical protein [Methylococcaceae bacterium]